MTEGWKRIASLMASFIVLAASSVAAANGLPINWSYQTTDDDVEVTITAIDTIRDVQFEAVDTETGESRSDERSSLRQGRDWTFSYPYPEHATTVRFTVTATYGSSSGTLRINVPIAPSDAVSFELVDYDFDSDERYEMVFEADRAIAEVRLTVTNTSGRTLAPVVETFSSARPTTRAAVSWPRRDEVLSIVVKVTDTSGTWREMRYVPWSFTVEQQALHFETGSAEIHPDDRETLERTFDELQAELERVGEYVELQLYIGGYTDTVGSSDANRRLSRDRARSIAEWFNRRGFGVPVYVQGFGESALAQSTPDNTPNASNRRAVFVLRSGPPPVGPLYPRNDWREAR